MGLYAHQGVEMALKLHRSNNQGVNVQSERTSETLIVNVKIYF